MTSIEEIEGFLKEGFPDAPITVVRNPSPAGQHSLLIARENARRMAGFLRDYDRLRLDYCSNVTGVDWPDRSEKAKVKTKVASPTGEGTEEREIEEVRIVPGYLEVVYHLYSMERRIGPVILRVRTGDRKNDVVIPSLTPVWRSCELQEREVYDLFGVRFEGHPDLRRLLMWEGFEDHPMRKDYVDPDDFDYEPTAHDEVLERVKARQAASMGREGMN